MRLFTPESTNKSTHATRNPSIKERPKKTVSAAAAKLHQRVKEHNYDDVPSKLRTIIRRKDCDLGTALMAYWRGNPNYYRMFPSRYSMKDYAGADVALFDVLVEIEQRVLDGKYKTFDIAYDPFDDLGANRAEEFYELDWDEFYYDLPVEMYGRTCEEWLEAVRPESDRPSGLTLLAEAEDETLSQFDPKIQKAIDALEKHNKEGNSNGVNLENNEDLDSGFRVDFMGVKVPDDIFMNLRDLPRVLSLTSGEKNTDAFMKYLRYTPELDRLSVRGTFSSKGFSHLKHVGELRVLNILDRGKTADWRILNHLSHTPKLERLTINAGEFAKFPLDAVGKMKGLQDLTLYCSFPVDIDFKPILKLKICDMAFCNRKITDEHIPALLELSKLRNLRSIYLRDCRFSKEGERELRKVFKKRLSL